MDNCRATTDRGALIGSGSIALAGLTKLMRVSPSFLRENETGVQYSMKAARAFGLAMATAAFVLSARAGATAPYSVEQTLVSLEKDSWRAWQDKDLAFWEMHLSSDHVEMDGPDGPTTKSDVISAIAQRKCIVVKYDLERFTFRQFDARTAMLVYKATQEFGCGGSNVTSVGWITSLYELRHGRWENVLFEHLPAKPS